MNNKFKIFDVCLISIITITMYQFIKYLKYGTFDVSIFFSHLLGVALFLIFFYILFRKNKNNKLPDYDERHKQIIKNFIVNIFFVLIFFISLSIYILYELDVKYISINTLFIFIISIWVLLVISAIIFIIKNLKE